MPRRDFKIPFAVSGDTASVPTNIQSDGSVSLIQGYGFDYERPTDGTDPLAKVFPRDVHNGLLNEITASIGEIQQLGHAAWSGGMAPYPENAQVSHEGSNWRSTVANNSATPGSTNSGWVPADAISGGSLIRTTIYTHNGTSQLISVNGSTPSTSGAGSFTPHPRAIRQIEKVQGAGGGGGGAANTNQGTLSATGGGQAGAYGEAMRASTAFAAVTVGVGGAGGTANSATFGSTGGASSLGSAISCPGGTGSQSQPTAQSSAGIYGGTALGAAPTGANLFSVRGGPGLYGLQLAGVAAAALGGAGGNSMFGSGPSATNGTAPGTDAINYGTGGSGAATYPSGTGRPGGRGANGIIIIEEYA